MRKTQRHVKGQSERDRGRWAVSAILNPGRGGKKETQRKIKGRKWRKKDRPCFLICKQSVIFSEQSSPLSTVTGSASSAALRLQQRVRSDVFVTKHVRKETMAGTAGSSANLEWPSMRLKMTYREKKCKCIFFFYGTSFKNITGTAQSVWFRQHRWS